MKKRSAFKGMALSLVSMFLLAIQIPASNAVPAPVEIIDNIFDGAIISKDTYILVGDHGRIYRTTVGGKTWSIIPSGTKENLLSITFPNKNQGWICGDKGLILNTEDGGMTWKTQKSGTSRDLLAISFADALHGVAAGDWGTVVRTDNGGKAWEDISLAEDVVLYDAHMIGADRVVVAGEFGMIVESDNKGVNWNSLVNAGDAADIPKTIFALDYDRDVLFAVGMDGIIQFSENWGRTWMKAQSPSNASLYNIEMEGASGWAVGDLGTVLRTEDGGKKWIKTNLPPAYKLSWVCAIATMKNSPPTGFAAGSKGLFFKINDNRLIW